MEARVCGLMSVMAMRVQPARAKCWATDAPMPAIYENNRVFLGNGLTGSSGASDEGYAWEESG